MNTKWNRTWKEVRVWLKGVAMALSICFKPTIRYVFVLVFFFCSHQSSGCAHKHNSPETIIHYLYIIHKLKFSMSLYSYIPLRSDHIDRIWRRLQNRDKYNCGILSRWSLDDSLSFKWPKFQIISSAFHLCETLILDLCSMRVGIICVLLLLFIEMVHKVLFQINNFILIEVNRFNRHDTDRCYAFGLLVSR